MTERLIKYFGIILIFSYCFIMIQQIYVNDYEDNEDRPALLSFAIGQENRFSDIRMNFTRNPSNFTDKIITAVITDNDLNEYGRWPWNRKIWARFIDEMKKLGVRFIAFDVFFYEPSEGDSDQVLAKAIKDFQVVEDDLPERRVILAYKIGKWDSIDENEQFYSVELDELEKLGKFSRDSIVIPDKISMFNSVTGTDNVNLSPHYIDPLNTIKVEEILNIDPEPALSFLGAKEDPDGVIRNYQIAAFLHEPDRKNRVSSLVPSFALRAFQVYKGNNLNLDYDVKNKVHILKFSEEENKSGWSIPLDRVGNTKVRWFGPGVSFPAINIEQILNHENLTEFIDENNKFTPNRTNKYPKEIFKDAAVFVGSIAYGAHDLRHSPVDAKLPGVYHHVNMFKQLLDKNTVKPIRESQFYSYLFLIAGTVLMIGVMYFGYAILDLLAVVALSGGFFAIDAYYLLPKGYEIKLFHVLLSVLASYSWSTFLHFYQTSKEKSKIRGTFKSFVSPAIVEKMLANPDMVKVGGEKRNITVMFSDVRDFTSISEKLTPDQLAQLLNRYMGIMTDILFKHGGTLDKYIGDAIVGFWGAPLDLANHPYHALKAGIEMIDALPPLNEQFAREGLPILKHGIGFNTGDCSVGNMGSSKIFQYTALGDNMNLGARLEGLCKTYGVQIICSEFTKNAIPESLQKEFKFRMLDKVKVKGKDKAVTIFEVLHASHPWMLNLDALNRWEESYNHYLSRNFSEAKTILIKLCQEYPDDVNCIRLLESSEDYINNPPDESWQGVTKFTTK
jgi:adenylate cyclase